MDEIKKEALSEEQLKDISGGGGFPDIFQNGMFYITMACPSDHWSVWAGKVSKDSNDFIALCNHYGTTYHLVSTLTDALLVMIGERTNHYLATGHKDYIVRWDSMSTLCDSTVSPAVNSSMFPPLEACL